MSASTPAAAAVDAARALHAEARLTNERRALVLAGPPGWTAGAARSVLDAVDLPIGNTTVVGERSPLDCETLRPPHADHLLGTTRAAVVVDCHDGPHPDALGRAVGAVDGGGLLLLLTPPLDAWPSRSVPDDPLAVPPHDPGDVGGRFVARLARTLRDHRGVGIVEASTGVECDGLTDPAPRLDGSGGATASNDTGFPAAAYDRCLTADQAGGLDALSALQNREGDRCAVVVEADRGRGKSSVAGIAAACLAADGDDVCVTAPDRSGVAPLFDRAKETLAALGALGRGQDDGTAGAVAATAGGRVRFVAPDAVADVDPDALIVDEAAAIPVPTLESYLSVDRLAFVTTVHGYEGTGRGFDVRFRGRLADDRPVTDCRLVTPIRYAPADPVEVWAFRALALNARPAVDPLVADADPDGVAYRAPSGDDLAADERRLREAFGLLVDAHYRTDPSDLRRLLDAPNMAVRTLERDGHVAAVALLAREGGLDAETCRACYAGDAIRGHLVSDMLTSQLRDPDAGAPSGVRIVRIAVHAACRSRGLGSRLIDGVRDEFAGDDAADWLGTAFGATPRLLRFWRRNGFRTVTLGTTRNDRSGRYAAVMLNPLTDDGRALHDRHAEWFRDRVVGLLSGPLTDCDPDVVRAALGAVDAPPALDLSERGWRTVTSAAYGPGLIDADPTPFRRLARRALIDPLDEPIDAREARLLVRRVLQGRPWDETADALDYPSVGQCRRAVCDAFCPLVDAYGGAAARRERERYSRS